MDPAEKPQGMPPSRFAPLTPLTLPSVTEARDEAMDSAVDSAGDSTASAAPFSHKSAPTTPRVSDHPRPLHPARGTTIPNYSELTKSKSTPYLSNTSRHLLPLPARRKKSKRATAAFEPSWTEVCARIGCGIVQGAHELHGYPWHTSRASTSARAGGGTMLEPDDYFFLEDADAYDMERERLVGSSKRMSRAASRDAAAAAGARSGSTSAVASPVHSRFASRSHSRVGLASAPRTPAERRVEGDYFSGEEEVVDEGLFAPDFLAQLEAEREEEEDDFDADEYLRQLENKAPWSWFRWLYGGKKTDPADDEDEDDDDDDDDDEELDEEQRQQREKLAADRNRIHNGAIEPVDPETVLPPHAYVGGWHDVVWFSALAVRALFN